MLEGPDTNRIREFRRIMSRAPYDAFALALLLSAGLRANAAISEHTLSYASVLVWLEGIFSCAFAALLLLCQITYLIRLTMIFFLATFSLVNAWEWMLGKGNCGCFGTIHVSPALTLTLDLSLLILVLTKPISAIARHPFTRRGANSPRAAIGMILVILVPIATAWPLNHPYASSFVDARQWIGKRIPILGLLDSQSRQDLRSGDRTLLIYDHRCESCQSYVRRLASEPNASTSGIRLLDISANPAEPYDLGSALPKLHLQSGAELNVSTPLEVTLNAGVVVKTRRPI